MLNLIYGIVEHFKIERKEDTVNIHTYTEGMEKAYKT